MLTLIGAYVAWHYSRALTDLSRNIMNIIWFLYHFFSIPILLATFFSPFQRLDESYGKGLDLERIGSVFVVNTLMRVVGICARTMFIAAGLASIAIAAVGGAAIFVAWLAAPLCIALLVGSGLTFLAI
jgi:hypothetical protein